MSVTILFTDEGEFFGAYVDGHIPPAAFPHDDVLDLARREFRDLLEEDEIDGWISLPVEHTFITSIRPPAAEAIDLENPVWVCTPDVTGARPVTGLFNCALPFKA